MSATATVEVIATVRAQFGPDFVPARVTAEEQVRTFLDAQLGAMDAERIVALGRLINQHGKLGSDPDTFNRVATQLWRAPIRQALATLGKIFADRPTFPHAGSPLPSFLLYLRDPDQFGICINATMLGLAHETGTTYNAKSGPAYEKFCADLRAWRQQYGVAPQEAEVILTTSCAPISRPRDRTCRPR